MPAAYEWQGHVVGYVGDNVCSETDILLIGIPCEVCEHCGVLKFKAEKG
jgi:hypothetical protein